MKSKMPLKLVNPRSNKRVREGGTRRGGLGRDKAARLLALVDLAEGGCLTESEVKWDEIMGFIESWLWECERIIHKGVETKASDGLDSEVFITGMSLCVILSQITAKMTVDWPGVEELLGAISTRILIHGPEVSNWTFQVFLILIKL